MFLKSNIDYLLEKHKTNPNELSEKHGIPQSTIFRIQNGLTENPRQSTLKAISEWSGVAVGDLLTKDLRLLDLIPGLTKVDDWDSNTPLDDDEVEIPFFEDFSFACGSGAVGEAMANETRKLRMSKETLRNRAIDKKNAVATRASGDSMNPTIKDGDTIHIDLGRKTIKDGKVFAICHGGLFMAKRLYNLPMGGIRIVSDNSAEFPEIQLTADDIVNQQFEIVGWIWQVSSMDTW